MQTNWSTTTSQVNLEELLAIQDKLRAEMDAKFLNESLYGTKMNSIFTPIAPIEFKWLEPPVPQVEQERLDSMKFRVFTDMSYSMFGVPKHVLFAADVDVPKLKPKNKWLRIAALVAAVIVFVLIWSTK